MSRSVFKIIGKVVLALVLAFDIWVAVSWVEVFSKNLDMTPDYCDSNFFVVLTEV